MPRLAYLTPCFWPEVRRGGERLVHELATGMSRRGHPARIVTAHPGPATRGVEDGVEVVRRRRPPDGRLRRRGYEDHLSHVPLAYRTLCDGADDLAHAVHVTDAVAAARWSARTGRPAVFTHLGIPDRRDLVARRRRLELMLRAVRGCRTVVAVSRHAAAAFDRWLGVPARVIHPPVDLGRFQPGGERAERPTIFCPAAVDVPHKRVDLLLAAFRRLREQRPEAQLVLLRPRDARLAADLAAADGDVSLMDDDHELLVDAYRRAWTTVLTSSDEAFGLVLAESLACGTPVVGSPHGGIPEIVDGEAVGRIFREDDPDAVARALLETMELAGDSATRKACVRRAEAFSAQRCLDAHEALYSELLESG
jgi:glycosyltransferase involved in cell wall biosynthesis